MVTNIRPTEPVGLDRDRLEHLYMQLGNNSADDVVSRAMEELAVRLAKVQKCYNRADLVELRSTAKSMVAVAEQIGMTTFARVAADVAYLAAGTDIAALGAVVARLDRIGGGSLMAVWDLQDITV